MRLTLMNTMYSLISHCVDRVFVAKTRERYIVLYRAVGTQRAYFELKYFKIVKMRDAKYSLKMAAEKWRLKFPFLNALNS